MTIVELTLDRCRIELTLGELHLQPFGIVHGGVLATLIDTATFWAGFMRLPEDAGLVNVAGARGVCTPHDKARAWRALSLLCPQTRGSGVDPSVARLNRPQSRH